MNGANTAKNATTPIQISPSRAPRRPTVSYMTWASHGRDASVAAAAGETGKGAGSGWAGVVADILEVLVVRDPGVGQRVTDVGDQQAEHADQRDHQRQRQ